MARLQDFQTVTPSDSDNLLVVQATGQGLATVGSTLGAKMDKSNPSGTGSLSLNRKSGSTVGDNSSAIGTDTIANHKAQHVFGEYNLADTSTAQASSRGNYVEIVGKGTSDASRSNARTLDWNGNEVLAGDLTIKGNKSIDTELLTKSTSTATFNTTDYVNTVSTNSLQKKNGMVQLDFTFRPKALNSVQNIIWGTIPSGYRPSTSVFVVASLVPNYTTSSSCKPLLISITDTGVIRTLNQGGYGDIGAVTTNTQIIIHAVYFV